MTRTLAVVALVAFVAGCGGRDDETADDLELTDGIRYKARLSSPRSDRREIEIRVTPVGADPAGALEAGRYEATRYCIERFGGSEVAWVDGPDASVDRLQLSGGSLFLRGRCAKR